MCVWLLSLAKSKLSWSFIFTFLAIASFRSLFRKTRSTRQHTMLTLHCPSPRMAMCRTYAVLRPWTASSDAHKSTLSYRLRSLCRCNAIIHRMRKFNWINCWSWLYGVCVWIQVVYHSIRVAIDVCRTFSMQTMIIIISTATTTTSTRWLFFVCFSGKFIANNLENIHFELTIYRAFDHARRTRTHTELPLFISFNTRVFHI